MTIEDQIRDEKLQYDVNREAAKISALSSGKTDQYEYLVGEEILTSTQQQIIEQAKFIYSPLGKAFKKQTSFSKFKGLMHIFKRIYYGDISLEDVKKEQIELKKDLGRIKKTDPKDKSPKQKNTVNNIRNIYNSR